MNWGKIQKMTAGLQCFMCNVSVVYRKGNVSKISLDVIKEELDGPFAIDFYWGFQPQECSK